MKLFKPLIIPLILIFGYLILTSYPYFFSKINRFDELGILSLVEEKRENIKKTGNTGEHLLAGEKITGELTSSENNLGILLVRFAQLSSNVTDTVAFRIKEEGKKAWYYENNYKVNQFQPDQYFTFGFTPFKNSKDEVYVFEVESLAGTYKNGIGLSFKKPQTALVYKYNKSDLKNVKALISFTFKKLVYVTGNISPIEKTQALVIFIVSSLATLFMQKKRITASDLVNFLLKRRDNRRKIFAIAKDLKAIYLLREKKITNLSKRTIRPFTSTKLYLLFLNTNIKKRLAIGLLIFLFAFLYRYSSSLVDQLGVSLFYEGLGGLGDYDQFIRAATCALRFCAAILGQNFLFESSILGAFYEIFGFAGGLKAYLFLMITLSSIVATLPYVLLSRKHILTIGGIAGSLFLATSDFLTHMALNLPPDNASVFTFSMFFIVYLFTIHIGTIRWLLFLGLAGTIDGLNKLILLPNDFAALILFIPVFLYEKAKRIKKFPFVKLNLKLIFYSLLPLLVFLLIYSAWELVVQIKFAIPYYLRALLEGGSTYSTSTDVSSMSINESLSKGNILEILYYYAGSAIVMQKRIIEQAGLSSMFLVPILIGLLFSTFRNTKFFIAKLISILIFGGVTALVLTLFRGNFLGIQEVGMYVYAWSDEIYLNVFLFASIIFLSILNFKYNAFKFVLPILPYVIILIILTKNVPVVRMLAHVIVWNIILFSFLTDWFLSDIKKDHRLKKLPIGPILLTLFILFYTIPKTENMVGRQYWGVIQNRAEIKYLRWVNQELPVNAVVLAGGESDLVTVSENLKRPIVYNTMWTAALLVKPNEIPLVKPTEFTILYQLKINEMPGVSPSDFSLVEELQNKDNFKKNRYLILEDDIYIWRSRLSGVADAVFATDPKTTLALHGEDFSIKIYKSNPALNRNIYELKLKEDEAL